MTGPAPTSTGDAVRHVNMFGQQVLHHTRTPFPFIIIQLQVPQHQQPQRDIPSQSDHHQPQHNAHSRTTLNADNRRPIDIQELRQAPRAIKPSGQDWQQAGRQNLETCNGTCSPSPAPPGWGLNHPSQTSKFSVTSSRHAISIESGNTTYKEGM